MLADRVVVLLGRPGRIRRDLRRRHCRGRRAAATRGAGALARAAVRRVAASAIGWPRPPDECALREAARRLNAWTSPSSASCRRR